MKRPNISQQEAAAYIQNAPTTIATALAGYVKQGRLSRAEADKYLLTAVNPHTDAVRVLAIRGYYLNSMGKKEVNDRGIYDDAIVLMGPNYFKTFNGNTDPRLAKAGIAMLLPGWHLFKQGLHNYKNPYPAFRTANAREVLPVLRDGQTGIKEGVTINLHKGGQYSTNSAGCQTIIADQWDEFKTDAYNLLKLEGQRVLPYLLIENL